MIHTIKTIQDILSIIEKLPEHFKVVNSCFTEDYSLICDIKNFEPIYSISYNDNIAIYSFNMKLDKALTNKEFILELLKLNLNYGLERDIDDGYVYSDYDFLIIRESDKLIILC